MRELLEGYKAGIVDSVPGANLALFLPALHGRGASLIDRSANGNDGTISGATWYRLPSGLKYLTFDGNNDVVTVSHDATLDPGTGNFSIAVWAKLTDKTDYRRMVTKEKAVNNWQGWSFFFTDATGVIRGYIRDASGNTVESIGTVDYSDSVWRHYVMTIELGSATGAQIYVNGAVVVLNTHDLTGIVDTLSTDADLYIGKFRDATGYFKGDMAMVTYYVGEVLTATEVLRLYNRQRRLFGV